MPSFEVLERRRYLAFGIAHVTPNLTDSNKLFEFQTRNVDFATGTISQPNQPFRYGLSKESDDTPNVGGFVARGFDDRVVARAIGVAEASRQSVQRSLYLAEA